jgi:hypothetical protein
LPAVLTILQRHQTLEESQTAVHQRLEDARGCLTDLPESNSTAGLAGIADYLEQQTAALGGLAPRI